MITKNSQELLEMSLESVRDLVGEIIIIDGNSSDRTREIAKPFNAGIFRYDEENLGKKRAYGLNKIKTEWVLVLDADEIVSQELKTEIAKLLNGSIAKKGFMIPYQNHFLGRRVNHGGENYKMLRLFRKDSVVIDPALVHEGFTLKKGEVGTLNNKIFHYSYRSLSQMLRKFTDYAVREAKQKAEKGERSSFRKIFLYPLHMFWARFVEDKGYEDWIFRILLDLGFAYMEFATYVLLCIYGWKKLKVKSFNSRFKIGFIIILFKTSQEEVQRLRLEIQGLKFRNYKIYFIDNTKDNRGYAAGVNEGIKKALTDNCDLFIVANPDISLRGLKGDEMLKGRAHFDIWGLAMKQDNKRYYGGEIDTWRMSGGLFTKKPKKRFAEADFVSGSLMMIKKKVVDAIGNWDERFFVYYEDVDYCYRAKKARYKVGVDTQLIYEHFELSQTNPDKKFVLEKARIQFLLKQGGWRQKIYEIVRVPKTIYEYFS